MLLPEARDWHGYQEPLLVADCCLVTPCGISYISRVLLNQAGPLLRHPPTGKPFLLLSLNHHTLYFSGFPWMTDQASFLGPRRIWASQQVCCSNQKYARLQFMNVYPLPEIPDMQAL